MVLTPALRGLFGLEWDALDHTLGVTPRLPADWDRAVIHRLRIGDSIVDLTYRRDGSSLVVEAQGAAPGSICLRGKEQRRADGCPARLTMPLPEVEIALSHGLPLPGSPTAGLKVTNQQSSPDAMVVTFEAPGGSIVELPVRLNRSGIKVSGATVGAGRLRLKFPQGAGYQRQTIEFRW